MQYQLEIIATAQRLRISDGELLQLARQGGSQAETLEDMTKAQKQQLMQLLQALERSGIR